MARGSSSAFGSSGSAIQPRYRNRAAGLFHRQPVQSTVRASQTLLLLLGLCLVACWTVLPALAQNDDIHITPRETKKTDATLAPDIPGDPSLRTHTKPLKKDVELVLVPVTITDPMNRLVTGLEKENFELTDNGRPQTIRHFSSEDAPISLGVIFDISGSMADKIDKSRQAVVEFFRTANPQDEFFLITFSEKPEVLVDFTSSVEDIQNKLVYAIPKGRTALLDAIYLGMNRMRKAHYERKALLIISDGGDNASRYTEGEVRSLVRESDVMIYAIGVYEAPGMRSRTPEEASGPGLLNDLCELTGGRHFPADISELPDIAAKIGVELRNRYVLGYIPTDQQHDGRYHPVVVKVVPPHGLPPLHAYWRRGYYAPSN